MTLMPALKLTVAPMNETSKPTVTIKKYANRRLYNTATSTYVTLETLAGMVKEGIEFCVYDAKTSEDITRSVLTQIIVEEEGKSGQQNLLPISFLRQLIGFYGDNMQWLVPKYLEHSMDMLANNQDQITNYFQTTFGNMFPFGSTLEEMGKKNLEMFERTLRMFSPFATATTTPDNQAGADHAPAAKKQEEPVVSKKEMPPAETMATVTTFHQQPETPKPVVTTPVIKPVVVPESLVEMTEDVPDPKTDPEPAPSTTIEAKVANSLEMSDTEIDTPEPVLEPVPDPVKACTVAETPATTEPSDIPPAFVSAAAPSASAPSLSVAAPVNTPMPNVQSIAASAAPTADDMQKKIANLQRQLAELARNRA